MKKGCGLFFLFAVVCAFLNFLPLSCNSVKVTQDPVSELIGVESMEPMFTVLLFDMDKEGVFSKVYKHRYRILKEKEEICEFGPPVLVVGQHSHRRQVVRAVHPIEWVHGVWPVHKTVHPVLHQSP